MNDLPIAPLFGAFTSPCKEPAKQKDEKDQYYFILERNVYNSFTGVANKLMIPCTYTTSNGRHSVVVESTKSSAVFSVAGELFTGAKLVQIICSEIEWSFFNALTQKEEKNKRTPKRENLLKFEQQIINKKQKTNSTLPTETTSDTKIQTPIASTSKSMQSTSNISNSSTLKSTSAPLEESRRRSERLTKTLNRAYNKNKSPLHDYKDEKIQEIETSNDDNDDQYIS